MLRHLASYVYEDVTQRKDSNMAKIGYLYLKSTRYEIPEGDAWVSANGGIRTVSVRYEVSPGNWANCLAAEVFADPVDTSSPKFRAFGELPSLVPDDVQDSYSSVDRPAVIKSYSSQGENRPAVQAHAGQAAIIGSYASPIGVTVERSHSTTPENADPVASFSSTPIEPIEPIESYSSKSATQPTIIDGGPQLEPGVPDNLFEIVKEELLKLPDTEFRTISSGKGEVRYHVATGLPVSATIHAPKGGILRAALNMITACLLDRQDVLRRAVLDESKESIEPAETTDIESA